MNVDLSQSFKSVQIAAAVQITDGGSYSSHYVDTGQFNSLFFVLNVFGSVTGGISVLHANESEDMVNWRAVPEELLIYDAKALGAWAAGGSYLIFCSAKSRYVRLVLTTKTPGAGGFNITAILGNYQGLHPGILP